MLTKRLAREIIQPDVESMNGFVAILGYQTSRPAATPEGL